MLVTQEVYCSAWREEKDGRGQKGRKREEGEGEGKVGRESIIGGGVVAEVRRRGKAGLGVGVSSWGAGVSLLPPFAFILAAQGPS